MKHKLFLVPVIAIALLQTGCLPKALSDEEVAKKVAACKAKQQKPWYTFARQGDKNSGVLYVECVDMNYPESEKNKENDSSLFDDDTPLSATDQPSLSGLPGGPF